MSTSTSPGPTRRGPARLLVVAAAGYGKTVALDGGLDDGSVVRARTLLGRTPPRTPHLGVDDLDELSLEDQERLMRELAALPGDVRLSIAARAPLAPSVRRLVPGLVFERGPTDLALSPEAVARVLRDEHGVEDTSLAGRVHELTAGWPALVQFAGDALAHATSPSEQLDALSGPGAAAATWVEHEVLADLPGPARAALEAVADLDVVTADLLALLVPGSAADQGAWLLRTGLLVPHPRRERCLSTVPLVAAVARRLSPGSGGSPRDPDRLLAAAGWYEAHGQPLAAAQALRRSGRETECVALLERRGKEILGAGAAAAVVDLLGGDAQPAGTTRRYLLADALRMCGDTAAADRALAPLVEAAEATDEWPAALAWRSARIRYMRADFRGTLDVLDRASDQGPVDADRLEVLAYRAHALSMLGDEVGARAQADAAVVAADMLGNDEAHASAHLAAANAHTGTTRQGHLTRARQFATRAGDVSMTGLALLNIACDLLAAARYDEAVDVAGDAVRIAERGCPPGTRTVALHNLGEALLRTGRYDEAELHLRRSVAVSREFGLQRSAFGLWGVAEIHRALGRREQGLVAYQHALDEARRTGEVQILVPVLCGLARLRAQVPEELPAARAAAEEAQRLACPEFATAAHLAQGWVAVAEGDREGAARWAARARDAARDTAAIDALADALELTAEVATEPREARLALEESLAIWSGGGAGAAADRVRVLIGGLAGADGPSRSAAREAGARLRRAGIRTVNGRPLDDADASAAVVVQLLGGFEVLVGGRPVPVSAWRSRQARTLVKLLASRRGRVLTRSEVCELLWPDDDPVKTGHRLSVLLSAVRAVLDPGHSWPADHYIRADLTGLSLDLTHVSLDVDRLLADAAHAEDLLRADDLDAAAEILGAIDAAYVGEALEDEPYAEWADGLREEARAAALRSLRNLAVLRNRTGRHEESAGLLVRLLATDAYDEAAHRGLVHALVRAGRHGEARRAFARWEEAMVAIEAPVPDPRVLTPGTPRPHAADRDLRRRTSTMLRSTS